MQPPTEVKEKQFNMDFTSDTFCLIILGIRDTIGITDGIFYIEMGFLASRLQLLLENICSVILTDGDTVLELLFFLDTPV